MIKQVLPLSGILALRFFGLFIVMPVLSLYALEMSGATPVLVGMAIGGYALTQVVLQIPFGFLSDGIGRKKVIFIGLLLFILGSITCAISSSIEWLIIGRFLQGAGAIGGVISAMIADLVREERRTKAMAVMGATISMSFTAAMILGPVIGSAFGVDKLFWLTAILAICAIFVLFMNVPEAPLVSYSFETRESDWREVIKDKNLQLMNLTNFLQKSFMTLAFLMIPLALVKGMGFESGELWQVYIPAAILGVVAMAPAAIMAEKKGHFKGVLIFGIVLFALSYVCMVSSEPIVFITGVMLFFIGFSAHEPIMQSLASRYAKAHQKGAALGIFTSFGYIGSFIGGVAGGYFYQSFGLFSIACAVGGLCIIWLVLIARMKNPAHQKNLYLSLIEHPRERLSGLLEISGVLEWYVNESEKVVIVKYDKSITSEELILARL
ncbi:MAG: MFS transporter [Wolinella sp.]